jgi:mannose-6-phosphate isomerase-like protein (cupin superfamily)
MDERDVPGAGPTRAGVSRPRDGQLISLGTLAPGTTLRVLLAGADTGGAVSVLEAVKAPGDGGPPPHRHPGIAELFYVLEGDMSFQVGDETIPAPAGTCVFVPGGLVHSFRNVGSTPARLLEVVIPGGLEGYFTAMAQLSQDADPASRAALNRAWGVEIAAPPEGTERTPR